MLSIQYYTQEEREQLLDKFSNKFLIEERNISEGNFLVFSDTPNTNILPVVVTQDEFETMEQRVKKLEDVLLAKG